MYNLGKYDHISDYCERAQIDTIRNDSFMQTVSLVCEVLLYEAPLYVIEELKFRRDVRMHNTRQGNILEVPRVQFETQRRGFFYFGLHMYNSVPPVIRQSSLYSFKNNYHRHVLNLKNININLNR